jgi:hypothetical protein
LSSKSSYNPVVDHEFQTLARSIPDFDPIFASCSPEHQWEGKYRLREGDVFVEAGAFWGRYGLIASKGWRKGEGHLDRASPIQH